MPLYGYPPNKYDALNQDIIKFVINFYKNLVPSTRGTKATTILRLSKTHQKARWSWVDFPSIKIMSKKYIQMTSTILSRKLHKKTCQNNVEIRQYWRVNVTLTLIQLVKSFGIT